MAEVALTSIAKSALTLFSSLAKDELLLLWSSTKELERLQATIDTIGKLLQDADKMQSNGEAVLSCLSRLRTVMYDADDLFDSLASELLRKRTMSGGSFTKEVRLFFSGSNQLGTVFKVAHQVKSLKESLDHVKEDMSKLCFRIPEPHVVQQPLRFDRVKEPSFVHQNDVIGRDEERDRIVNMLVPASEQSSVVAVIGFGGLGKTTLAQLVYNDKRVRKEFDVCLWACVNYLSDLEHVLIEILASSGDGKHHDLGLEELHKKLRAIVGGKKVLLVIDDLWDDNHQNWSRLDSILRCGISYKLLVTTRNTNVAACLDAPKSNYVNLEVLSEESAWSLFVRNAFPEGEANECPELEAVGRKIVRRCRYVPLAVIIIGRLLRHRKKEEPIWSDFLCNEMGRVLSNSGFDKTHKSIIDVLMVSYKDLHSNLKLCFAYCSLFPKDFKFDKDTLIRFWISQGFVKLDEGNRQSLEELGEEYFFYLVDRCFFQQLLKYSSTYEDGHSAQMHDLLHDMSIHVAKEESMLLDKDHINKGKIVGLRHISVHPEIDSSFSYCDMVSDPSIVRTILFRPTKQHKTISYGSLNKLLEGFRMLRTLKLSNLGIERIPDSIGELIHLRYLDLSHNRTLRQLPDSICKIHNLMTLDLMFCFMLEKLPRKIEKLISLRHLLVQRCDALECLPQGLAELTSLVNLDRLIVHRESGGLRFLNSLDDLCGYLSVELPREGWPNAAEDAKRSNMSRKHKLKSLRVCWNEKRVEGNPTRDITTEEVEAVLEALEPSENLEHLSIENYGGAKLPSWLFMIKNLKKMLLSGFNHLEYLEDKMKDNLCFTSLTSLVVLDMGKLKGWWKQEISDESQRPCLPKVSSLYIHNCLDFKGIVPIFDGIEALHLSRVDVKWVPELMIGSLKSSSPSSSSPFSINKKLKQVDLSDIKGLTCLPEEWIRHLTALCKLRVAFCGGLRWVSRRGLAKLSALTHLELQNWNCEIRDEDEDKVGVEVGMPWKALPSLETLEIPVSDMHIREGIGYLTSLKTLRIENWENEEDVELISKALQNLHTLGIGFGGDKTCDLHKTGVQNLPFLTNLSIEGCKLYLSWNTVLGSMKLVDLQITVECLIDVEDTVVLEKQSQLRSLTILCLKGASKWVHDIPWKSLASLVYLRIAAGEGETEEQLLPNGIQHLSSLNQLYIIGGVKQLKSIPVWFPLLESLQRLIIIGCSEELKRRCIRGKGEDWPLLCHITRDVYIESSDDLEEGEGSPAPSVNDPLNEGSSEVRRKIGWCGLKI